MRPSVAKTAKTLGLAITLGLTFTPLGCDSTQALPSPAFSESPNGPEVPRSTEQAITKCAEHGISRLTKDYNTVIFDVKANKSGSVLEARVSDSDFPGDEIEGCVKHALLAMHVSPWIVSLGSPAPGEGASRESRGQVGFAEALGAAVQLVPILVVAAGVTVIVVVAIYIVSEVATTTTTTTTTTDDEQEKERCKKVKQQCVAYCSDTTLPTPDFGWKFQKCKNECLEKQACPRDS